MRTLLPNDPSTLFTFYKEYGEAKDEYGKLPDAFKSETKERKLTKKSKGS